MMSVTIFSFSEEENDIDHNRLIDTYIIATAISMDYDSQIILPNIEYYEIYEETKAYFKEFKTHPFIGEISNYSNGDDINGDCIGVIIADINGEPVDSRYRYGVFKSQRNIDSFIEGLHKFYKDTNASKFFDEHSLYPTVEKYIDEQIDHSKYDELKKQMISF